MTTKKKTPINVNKVARPINALPEYKCRFCQYEWLPRVNIPVQCPNCHKKRWWK